jgi:murein DD-endopeptidase MepM/ murein hydrolase activator NlpD
MALHKRKTRFINFLIVPENSERTWNFNIRLIFLQAIGVVVAVLIGLVILGASTYWKVAELALDYNRLNEENIKLRKSLQKMDELREDLVRLQQFNKQIRSSLSGYVTIEKNSSADTLSLATTRLAELPIEQQKTIFNSIPALLPVDGYMTRGFETSSLFRDAHVGVDIVAPVGTPIKASADGIVEFADWTADGGNMVIIKHGHGFSTIYKHNLRNTVVRMEKVVKGQAIALLGNTGQITSGAHVHFEIWRNGIPVNPIFYVGEINRK